MPETTDAPTSRRSRSGKRETEQNDTQGENLPVNVSHNERVFSVVGGSLLTWIGFHRHSTLGAFMMLMGGGLLRRGTTGYCPVSAWMGSGVDEQGKPVREERRHSKHTSNGR